MAGRRVPRARSSTSLCPEQRGCLGRGSRDTAPGCTAPPARTAGAGPDPGVPWEEVGGPKQESWQAERLWPGGQGERREGVSLGGLGTSLRLLHPEQGSPCAPCPLGLYAHQHPVSSAVGKGPSSKPMDGTGSGGGGGEVLQKSSDPGDLLPLARCQLPAQQLRRSSDPGLLAVREFGACCHGAPLLLGVICPGPTASDGLSCAPCLSADSSEGLQASPRAQRGHRCPPRWGPRQGDSALPAPAPPGARALLCCRGLPGPGGTNLSRSLQEIPYHLLSRATPSLRGCV